MTDHEGAVWDVPTGSWIVSLGTHGPAGTATWPLDESLTIMVDPTRERYCGVVITPPLTDAARSIVELLFGPTLSLASPPDDGQPLSFDVSIESSPQAAAFARLTCLVEPLGEHDPASEVAVEIERGYLAKEAGLLELAGQVASLVEEDPATGALLDSLAAAPPAIIARFRAALATLAELPVAGRNLRAGLRSLGTSEHLASELERFLVTVTPGAGAIAPDAGRLVLRAGAERFSRVLVLDPATVPASLVDFGNGALVERGDIEGTAVVSCRLSADVPGGNSRLWARAFRAEDGALVAMVEMGRDGEKLIGRLFIGDVEPVEDLEFDITAVPADPPESARVRQLRDAVRVGAEAASAERLGQHSSAARLWMACAARWASVDQERQLAAMALAATSYEQAGETEMALGADERIEMLAPGRSETELTDFAGRLAPEPFLVELLALHQTGASRQS